MLIDRGYSFIELLCALFVFIVAIFMSYPSLKNLVEKEQMQVVINRINLALLNARTEAVTRGQTVTLCASADKQHCGGEWRDGMLLLVAGESNQTSQTIRVYPALPVGAYLNWNAGANMIQFAADGYLKSQPGTLTYCLYGINRQSGVLKTKAIVISRTGRTRIIN